VVNVSDKIDFELVSAAVRSLRQIFTHLYHEGRMSTSKSNAAQDVAEGGKLTGVKRKRPSDEADGGQLRSLHQLFGTYLHALVSVLGRKAGTKSGLDDDTLLQLQVASLGAVMHFAAHANSLAGQVAQGSTALRYEVITLLLRRLLAAGGKAGKGAYATDETNTGAASDSVRVLTGESAQLLPYLSSDFSTGVAGFRVEFVDEYSDVRYASLKAVRDVVKEAQTARAQASKAASKSKKEKERAASSADDSADSSGFDALGRRLTAAAHPRLLGGAAVDFLLSTSLPLTEAEWNESEHSSWAEDQVGEAVEQWKTANPVEAATILSAAGKSNGATNDEEAGADADGSGAAAVASKVKFLSADSESDSDEGDEGAIAKAASKASGAGGGKKSKRNLPKWAEYSAVRRAYAEAWLAVLQLPLPPDAMRRVLLALPTRIIPLMPDRFPLLLADFLTTATDAGGALALMALEALFQLMQNHGLEYPRFYPRLYALLTPSTMHAKYRARCFTLLDLFLSSAALPAYLVAAFAKRMARLALTAPTPALSFALVFVYNCLKRHPSILPLLHRANAANASSGSAPATAVAWPNAADPFDAVTDDPAACRALESSLWEIITLQQYAHPNVSNIARVFNSTLTMGTGTVQVGGSVNTPLGVGVGPGGLMLNKSEYEVSSYASTTFQSLIDAEKDRSARKSEKAASASSGGDGGKAKTVSEAVPFEFIAPPTAFATTAAASAQPGTVDQVKAKYARANVLDTVCDYSC
jgi:hypothetical protein